MSASRSSCLKIARDLNAPNVLHALKPKVTCLLDTPQADRQAGVIYLDMEVATGGDHRRYLKNHPRQYISLKYDAWVGHQILWAWVGSMKGWSSTEISKWTTFSSSK